MHFLVFDYLLLLLFVVFLLISLSGVCVCVCVWWLSSAHTVHSTHELHTTAADACRVQCSAHVQATDSGNVRR